MSATHHTVPLRDAVVTIMEKITDSGLHQLLSSYLRLIAPTMAKADKGEQHFPRTLMPNARSNRRRCLYSKFGDVLVFHLNRALLGYYALVDDRGTIEDEAHIRRLLKIAAGFSFFKVCGTDHSGFHLMTENEYMQGMTEPIDACIQEINHERGLYDRVSSMQRDNSLLPSLPAGRPSRRLGNESVVDQEQVSDSGRTRGGLVE